MKPEVGKSYSLFYNENNVNNRRIHVRAVVDDEQYVIRTWFRSKVNWHYEVKNIHWFECNEKYLTEVR
jgi:hypothetical protein